MGLHGVCPTDAEQDVLQVRSVRQAGNHPPAARREVQHRPPPSPRAHALLIGAGGDDQGRRMVWRRRVVHAQREGAGSVMQPGGGAMEQGNVADELASGTSDQRRAPGVGGHQAQRRINPAQGTKRVPEGFGRRHRKHRERVVGRGGGRTERLSGGPCLLGTRELAAPSHPCSTAQRVTVCPPRQRVLQRHETVVIAPPEPQHAFPLQETRGALRVLVRGAPWSPADHPTERRVQGHHPRRVQGTARGQCRQGPALQAHGHELGVHSRTPPRLERHPRHAVPDVHPPREKGPATRVPGQWVRAHRPVGKELRLQPVALHGGRLQHGPLPVKVLDRGVRAGHQRLRVLRVPPAHPRPLPLRDVHPWRNGPRRGASVGHLLRVIKELQVVYS